MRIFLPRERGYRKWLGEWCTFRDRNAFRDHKSFIGNANAMEAWISGLYHTLRSLECTGNRRVSKD